jgi:hypothetical protein
MHPLDLSLLIVACLLYLLALAWVFVPRILHHYYKSLIPFFVLAVAAVWCLYYPAAKTEGVNNPFLKALSDAVGSLALQSDEDLLNDFASYEAQRWLVTIFSIGNFIMASFALVSLSVRAFWGDLLYLFSFQKKRYAIFTDLSYPELEEFIKGIKDKGGHVVIVLSKTGQYSQPGYELRDQLKYNHNAVILADSGYEFLKRFASPWAQKYTLYSVYRDDVNNQRFALTLAQLFDAAKTPKLAKRAKKKITAYVSYQDPTFEERYNFEKQSEGHIRFYSEYQWVAQNFVFEHPVTSYLPFEDHADPRYAGRPTLRRGRPGASEKENDYGSIGEKGFPRFLSEQIRPIQVNFFGFGQINQALFRQMLAAYQLPGDGHFVRYRAYDKHEGGAGADDPVESTNASLEAFSEESRSTAMGPQYDPLRIEGSPLDLADEEKLFELLERRDGHSFHDEISGQSPLKEVFLVSLGGSELSLQIALKTRDKIKKMLANEGLRCEQIVIYVYVRESYAYKGFSPSSGIYEESEADTASFRNDDCPVVIFGRNGRFAMDERQATLTELAIRCSNVYSLYIKPDPSYQLVQRTFAEDGRDALTWAGTAPRQYIDNAWAEERARQNFYQDSYRDRQSNYAAALALPAKLDFLGLRLAHVTHRPSAQELKKELKKGNVQPFVAQEISDENYVVAYQVLKKRPDGHLAYYLLEPSFEATFEEGLRSLTPEKKEEVLQSREDLRKDKKKRDKLIQQRIYCSQDYEAVHETAPLALYVKNTTAREDLDVEAITELRKQADLSLANKAKKKISDEECFAPVNAYVEAAYYQGHLPLTDNFAQMEHNRWSFYAIGRGDVPISQAYYESLNQARKASKPDSFNNGDVQVKEPTEKRIHACITTNEGLVELRKALTKTRLSYCTATQIPNVVTKNSQTMDIDTQYGLEYGLLSDYQLVYWNDTFQLQYIDILLKGSGYTLEERPARKEEGGAELKANAPTTKATNPSQRQTR